MNLIVNKSHMHRNIDRSTYWKFSFGLYCMTSLELNHEIRTKILNGYEILFLLHHTYTTSLDWIGYTDSTKINRPGHSIRMYRTADCSCTTKYFWKNSYRSLYYTSLCFFWHLLRQNWSNIQGTVSLWSMFENWRFPVFEGKCRRFRNSSDCLKTHCAANNWLIWTQKVPKEA